MSMPNFDILSETYPPGNLIKEELEARGWTQRDLAEIMRLQPSIISGLVKGTKPISLDLAQNLAAAFGTSVDFWIFSEMAYRIRRLPTDRHADTTKRAELYNVAPVRDLVDGGYIESSENVDVMRDRVLKYFGAKTLAEVAKRKPASRTEHPSRKIKRRG
jgi:HTH-type transcriptional regulator / antitoxin HigA